MFKRGDIVAVCGATVTDKLIKKNLHVAKVIEVGLHDLIVEPHGRYMTSHLKVSKAICVLIKLKWDKNPSPDPSIGDLVLYYNKKYDGEIEKAVGHLHEIEYEPGKAPMGKVMVESEMKSFSLKSLIILEKHV